MREPSAHAEPGDISRSVQNTSKEAWPHHLHLVVSTPSARMHDTQEPPPDKADVGDPIDHGFTILCW
jgi:hypothetical protein